MNQQALAAALVPIILGLGLLGGIGLGINAVLQRRNLKAKAEADNAKAKTDNATADSIIAAAARELLDPLRQELANERADHAKEIEVERGRLIEVQEALDTALKTARELRNELAMARVEADALRREREMHKQKIRQQDEEIARLLAEKEAKEQEEASRDSS